MIRTLVPDVLRYGDYSRLGESIYDHPYQWGSKRTGPDLARVGGKYHATSGISGTLKNPRSDVGRIRTCPTTRGCSTNATPYLGDAAREDLRATRTLGVPYPELVRPRADRDPAR